MKAKMKHLISLTLQDLKDLGVIGKKKKRRKKRARALQEQVARENQRGTSEHMVGYSKPSASSQFSNSNNIAIDTQHRVNEAIRQKEELERKIKADEPTLESKQKELESKVNFGLNHLNSKFGGPNTIDDTPPEIMNAPPVSNQFIAQTPQRHVTLVEIQTPNTNTDYGYFDGGSSKRSMFADVNNDPWNSPEPYDGEADDIDNYNTWDTPKAKEEEEEKKDEEKKEEEKKEDEPIPAVEKKLGYNAAREVLKQKIVSDTGKPLPSGMENTTSKQTLVSYWNRLKHIRETEANDKTFKQMFKKK